MAGSDTILEVWSRTNYVIDLKFIHLLVKFQNMKGVCIVMTFRKEKIHNIKLKWEKRYCPEVRKNCFREFCGGPLQGGSYIYLFLCIS